MDEVKLQSNQIGGALIEGTKTITNLDELPPDYQSIIDGTYDEKLNADMAKDGLGYIEGCRQSGHMKSYCLAFFAFASVLALIILIIEVGLVGLALLSLVIFCCCGYHCEWAFCASTAKYLDNIMGKDSCYEEIKRLHGLIPTIQWKVECYHYRTYTDSKGRRKRKKVVTHRASMNYVFNTVRDISAEFKGLGEWKLTKLTTYKTFTFANAQTENDYNFKLQEFRRNNDRDTHKNFSVIMKLDEFKPKLLIESGERSKYLTKDWYCLFSWFLCGPCYRTVFSSKTGVKHYIIQKEISI